MKHLSGRLPAGSDGVVQVVWDDQEEALYREWVREQVEAREEAEFRCSPVRVSLPLVLAVSSEQRRSIARG